MTSRVKIFLLWLLAFAIPVQGFAAALQMGCATSPQTPAIHEAAAPAFSMDEHSAHGMHAMHSMHDTNMRAQADTGPATDHAMPHLHKASAASCSSCSVCTIGAILPLALDKLINLPVAADIHVAMVQHGFVGYTPENPERPPSLPV
ncbi:hypothetical protein [Herbaspirillum rhizosphaerae]|uniref:hypothetical protein n=1 Tax=Herbaspirillum rhizosphaerae TaxID=346179 RepID=UPI00067CE2F0|nr:hypothetical protein [Herbaspirillum rhizosphaerae]